jgi:PAS domain S-box-containing protein
MSLNNIGPHGSEDQFRLFADSVMDHAYHALDATGGVASWNRGAERLFGYTADEVSGLAFESFYPEDARSRRDPERELAIANERGHYEIEGWRVRKDGGVIGAYVVITALRDAQDALSGYAVVTRNISEHQRSLQELQDQKRRLRSIVETAVDAVVIIDDRGIVESFNPAGERMFGYKADEVVGQNVNMLMPQPFAGEHTGYLQRYLRTGEAKIIGIGREVQGRRKDGSLFPADLAVSEFYDGKPLFTGILRDITGRKKMEAEILQIAEAEQRRIGQELHDDAQQQLAGLTMIARNAADALAPFVSQESKLADVLVKLERVVKGLRDANQSLREVARGLVPLQIDAHGLLDALARLAAQVSELHAVRCSFSVDDGIDVDDGGVSTHLYRITQEAVNNSLKHSQAKEISIRFRYVDRMIVLEIADDGIGIGDKRETLGRGLQIMAYRAGLIGAVLSVRRINGGGTLVSCGLPRP